MTESVFIDTGYILALVNENDQHHAEALLLSERYDGQPVVVTDAVLLEIGNALSRMDRNAAVQVIQDLRPPRVSRIDGGALDAGAVRIGFRPVSAPYRQAMGVG
jgi:predicted nucleic acid-binding protein